MYEIEKQIQLNKSFGYWTVLDIPKNIKYNGRSNKMVKCRCICGKEKFVFIRNLIYTSKSCGCKRIELQKITLNSKGDNRRKLVKINDKFNFWTVISKPEYKIYGKTNPQSVQFVNAQCICGQIRKNIAVGRLKNGKSKSCGCKKIELYLNHSTSKKHGDYNTRLYKLWGNIKQRCYNSNTRKFRIYGGKGIKMCDEWLDYLKFKNWALNNGYKENLTINRKDSSKNYCPENCEWITLKENSNVVKWRDEKIQLLEQQINFLQKENNNLQSQLTNFKNNQNLVFA